MDKVVPVSVDVAAVEPGCPHCGSAIGHDRHPTSSRPAAPALPVPPQKVKPKPIEPVRPPARPDGKFTYELFVSLMGRKDTAVSWDKLTGDAQRVWVGVAHGVERQTIDAFMHERSVTITKKN